MFFQRIILCSWATSPRADRRGHGIIASGLKPHCRGHHHAPRPCLSQMGGSQVECHKLVVNAIDKLRPCSSTPLLEKLHWPPISERIKYKVACMCFSAINGSGPAYLSELLHVYTPSRTLRSSSDIRMLEIQQYKRKIHGFRTFSCFGLHIWNSLPQDLRHC